MKITVFGSGNGGCATAFDFAQHGHDVYIIDLPEFSQSLTRIAEDGGIRSEGVLEGFASIAYAGTDIQKGVEHAELLIIVGPAYSTEPIAKACKPYLKDGQKVLLLPSSCGGSIIFKRTIGRKLQDTGIWVAETSTLPYAVRVLDSGLTHVYLKLKGGYFMAALPSSLNEDFFKIIEDVYPEIELADNVLQTSLQNANPVIHPSVTLLNAALVERTGGNFLFYEEGVTLASGRLIEAVDNERIAIGEKLGIKVWPDPIVGMKQGYMAEENYTTGYSKAPGFKGIMAQNHLENRYLNEDVGYGLVFFTDLADALGVDTPVMDSVIIIASIIMGKDYKGMRARTLDTLGLEGLSAKEMIHRVR